MSKINILMPTFNPNLGWLRQALTSIGGQGCRDYQLILVNDGSSKVSGTEINALAQELLPGRYVFHNLPKNVGFNKAITYALQQANAPYAVVLGDDDYFTDGDYFRHVIEQLDANPQANVALADYILRREELNVEEPIRIFHGRAQEVRDGLDVFWERFWLPAVPAVGWGSLVFRVETARELGGFREPVRDMRLFIQLLQSGQMVYLPILASCYRYRQGNTSSRGNVDVLRASLQNVSGLAREAFDSACRLRPLDEKEQTRRERIMIGTCRVHAGRNLRYFRSLGRITFGQAMGLFPLVFTGHTPAFFMRSALCFLSLLLPPGLLRWVKACYIACRKAGR